MNPYATQVTAGYTLRLGNTGLFADFEGIYVKGDDEIIIQRPELGRATASRAAGRTRRATSSTPTRTRAGPSTRRSWRASTARSRAATSSPHRSPSPTRRTSTTTSARRSPTTRTIPPNLEAEWGRRAATSGTGSSRPPCSACRHRFTVAPIFEYGSGQPWNSRLGYDCNGDGRQLGSPGREARVLARTGPNFMSVNLRLTYRLPLGSRAKAGPDRRGLQPVQPHELRRELAPVTTKYLSGPTLDRAGGGARAEPELQELHARCRRSRRNWRSRHVLARRQRSRAGTRVRNRRRSGT